MAKPRVFVSSTYYDLKGMRDDLDRFVSSLGYETVLHEKGQISYGREDKPEVYAYREIEYCDVLVSIIGGKFGTVATESQYSISQSELRKAVDLGKQIYIFVDRSVQNEYKYYQTNRDVAGVKYTAVNDVRIYSFLEEVYALPKGNPVFSFDTPSDIITILREQFAGLFQRLLLEDSSRIQTSLTQELQRSIQTVDQLVKFLTDEKTKGDKAIQEILFSNHPIFEAIREKTKNKYRIYFSNLKEFEEWLKSARSYSPVEEFVWDDPEFMEWVRNVPGSTGEINLLFVKKDLFDENGSLKPINHSQWNDDWVRTDRRTTFISEKLDPDDIPF
jgi:hypothetical protein